MITRQSLKPWLPLIIAGMLISGLIGLQTGRLQNLQSDNRAEWSLSDIEEQQRRTQAHLLAIGKMPSFGFDNLIASWSFLQFLQYFGDMPARQQTGYGLSPYFFEIIIPRDPHYVRSYVFLSSSTSAHAAQPKRAIALMEEGLPHLSPNLPSDSYLVWRYKGLDEFLFLGDYASSQVSLATAAEWVRQSDTPDGQAIANSLQQTAHFLAQNPTGRGAQIGAWAQVLVQAADEATRQIAIKNIEALGGEITVSEAGRVSVRHPADDYYWD